MISSLLRSHGKFLLDYIVGKGFELDIELKQTFLPSEPESLAGSYCFIAFIKKCWEVPVVKLRSRSSTDGIH